LKKKKFTIDEKNYRLILEEKLKPGGDANYFLITPISPGWEGYTNHGTITIKYFSKEIIQNA
jgi:hypothetical protein